MTTFSLRYVSSRREVWAWYWRSWLQGRWRVHLAVFATMAGAALLSSALRGSLSPADAVPALAVALIGVAWMPFFPLLAFKPQERTLEFDVEGLSTLIGRRLGRRSWSEIAAVDQMGTAVVIACRNGNAFIVPLRAFLSAADRDRFLIFAREAQRAAGRTA